MKQSVLNDYSPEGTTLICELTYLYANCTNAMQHDDTQSKIRRSGAIGWGTFSGTSFGATGNLIARYHGR
jgi:hypothetical protein